MAKIAGLEYWEVKYLEAADINRRISQGFATTKCWLCGLGYLASYKDCPHCRCESAARNGVEHG